VRFSVVLATDGLRQSEPPTRWQRLLFSQAAARQNNDATALAELSALLTQVGQLVESTLVVDRQTGLSFDKRLAKL